MEENRKPLIISGFGLAFLMVMIVSLIIISNPWEELRSLAVGSALGLGIGIGVCWHLLRTWDPATLRTKENHKSGCGLIVIATGSIVAGRLLFSHINIELLDMLIGCVLSTITLVLFFLACLAWWYRPRNPH